MNDIRPPKRTLQSSQRDDSLSAAPKVTQLSDTQDTLDSQLSSNNLQLTAKPSRKKRWIIGIIATIIISLLLGVAGAYIWYQRQLEPPVDAIDAKEKRLIIEQGSGIGLIASQLKSEGLIRSEVAFDWYLRLNSGEPLQAGAYVLTTGNSTPEVVKALRSGKTETISITFLPGATVDDNKAVLKSVGFSDDSIQAAFSKQYDHPVFKDKPTSADLEGYIFGETYQFPADVTVEAILQRTFDELYSAVTTKGLVSAYKEQGLNLYEGITLASIIQREVVTSQDQAEVAGVFYNRLEQGMNLGSDVTYQYIADKTGVPRNPDLDSPYNTRKYTGLPPGPIAAPGLSALLAVAKPVKSDYLFFLSGDDDKTYFGRTQAEHESNITKHCQKKCQIL